MPTRLLALLFLACLTIPALAQTQAASAGTTSKAAVIAAKIDLVEGDVRILDKLQKSRKAAVGDLIYEGDSVVTGADGELHMTMQDEGFIAVRRNTKMSIAEFRAEGDEQDKGIFRLFVGSMRSITGWIGKFQPRSYAIRTPTATIGIRGTDHEPMVIAPGSTEGEAGTYDKVNIGASYIETPQGRIDVSEKRAAFAPHSGKRGMRRPRLLESVPGFYRVGRNEHLIEKKHEFIQGIMKDRREQRRQKIRERLKERGDRGGENAQTRKAGREERKNRRQKMREERQQNKEESHARKKRRESE